MNMLIDIALSPLEATMNDVIVQSAVRQAALD